MAFNPGTLPERAFTALTEQQDYTAGEQNTFTATPETHPPSPAGLQWHILAHLGTTWGKADGPQLSDAEMIAYIKDVNAAGGVVSMDVQITNGNVYGPHLRQLVAIGTAVRQP